MKSYRKKASMRRASRARAVAMLVPRPPASLPSRWGNRLVMAGLYLALLLGIAFFLGLMVLLISG